MRKTDYSSIATRYDANPARRQAAVDQDLVAHIDRISREDFSVLDLGCGTGTYLAEAHEYRLHGSKSVIARK